MWISLCICVYKLCQANLCVYPRDLQSSRHNGFQCIYDMCCHALLYSVGPGLTYRHLIKQFRWNIQEIFDNVKHNTLWLYLLWKKTFFAFFFLCDGIVDHLDIFDLIALSICQYICRSLSLCFNRIDNNSLADTERGASRFQCVMYKSWLYWLSLWLLVCGNLLKQSSH